MGFPVSYYCPHYDAVVKLEYGGYLTDRSVAPYPLEEQAYADPSNDFEDTEGVQPICDEGVDENTDASEGDSPLSQTGDMVDADGAEQPGLASSCGRGFCPSFVRYEDDHEVEAVPESDHVVIGGRIPSGPPGPRGPDAGSRGSSGF